MISYIFREEENSNRLKELGVLLFLVLIICLDFIFCLGRVWGVD